MTDEQRQQLADIVMRMRAIREEWSATDAEEAYEVLCGELEPLANKLLSIGSLERRA